MIFKLGLVFAVAGYFSTTARAAEETVSILAVSQEDSRPGFANSLFWLSPILTTNLSKQVVTYQENLNFTRFGGNDYRKELSKWLRDKYRGRKLNAIVVSGKQAVDFVLKTRPTAWPQVPVIVIANAETVTNSLDGQTNITGFIVDVDVQGTLKAAVGLFPNTHWIAFISPGETGQNDASESYRRDLQQAEDFCTNRFQLIKLTGLTMAETKRRLAELPPDTIVFYDDIRANMSGPVLPPWIILEDLNSVSRAPIFSYSEFYIGYGMAGGMSINRQTLSSEMAGQIAAVVRAGNASSIPVAQDKSSRFVFDWRQLQKYGVNAQRLPPNSEGRFRPPSLWQAYHTILIIILAALVVQTGLILVLLWQRRRMKRTEEELSGSQRMLRIVLDTIPQHVFWKDRNSVFLGCNKPVIEECGNVIGKTDFETTTAKHAEQYRADDLEVMEKNQPKLNFEEPQTRKDGSHGWYRISKVPLHDKDGKVIGILGTYDDITELKQAEEALRESERRMRTLAEASFEGICISENGRILDMNDQFCVMFGYERNELIGREITTLITPQWQQIIADRICTNEEKRIEHQCQRKDGSVFECEAQARTISMGGRAVRVSAVRDLTERKKAEESLIKLSRVVEQTADSVLITNRAGVIEYVNPSFETMTGYTKEEAIGKTPRILKSGRQDSEFYANLWKQILGGKVYRGVLTNRKKNGELLDMEITITPVKDNLGHITHFVSTDKDVTERNELEARLRQVQKMQAFGQLAAGVAHDFNNILTVVQGNVSLLQMGKLTPDEQASVNSEIFRAIERATNLIRQLLTFSRRQPMQPQNLDLNAVVTNVTKMLQRLIGEDIALETHYAPGHALIHADLGMMEQVLMNLAVNSRDAMPKGGRLVIETASIVLNDTTQAKKHSARPGEFIRLSITDTGCGIAPENLPHIFEPFFTTKDVGKGTGLGLATVFGVVEQHHGWIEVESQLKKGTTFHVYFPQLAKKIVNHKRPTTPPIVPNGTETILLVEDEIAVRQLMQHLLERHGYHIHAADSGVQALEIWRNRRDEIGILVTDIVMPNGMNGRELADRLRTEKSNLKIIYCSGYANHVPGKDYPLRKNESFMEKPFEPVKFLQLIRDCADAKN